MFDINGAGEGSKCDQNLTQHVSLFARHAFLESDGLFFRIVLPATEDLELLFL